MGRLIAFAFLAQFAATLALAAGAERAPVPRGWLGVHIQEVTEEIAGSIGLAPARGALVAKVVAGSPAESAGIKPGDVIVEFNTQAVAQMRELPRLVAETGARASASLVVWRDKRLVRLSLRLGILTETPPVTAPTALPALGITVGALTPELRRTHKIADDVSGVVVTAVETGSKAEKTNFKVGHVILKMNQRAVQSPRDVIAEVRNAYDSGRGKILILVNRGDDQYFVQPQLAAGVVPAAPVPVASAPSPRAAPAPVVFAKGAQAPDDIAVIIGNADYSRFGRDIPNVTPAHADAEAFKRYVTQALGVRPGNIIELRDATGAQMVSVFGSPTNHKGKLFNWTRPGLSRIYVYYAGHGAPAGADGSAYLVPSDADAATIELNGYPLSVLYTNLGKIPAKSVTVVMESCFSGASAGGSVITNASSVYVKAKAPRIPSNVTVISAGASDQMASWEKDKSRSLFTKYFLMGMSGKADADPYGNNDGTVGFDELERYLARTLTYFARRYYGRDQNAQFVTGGK